ncbi:MAG TPA: MerR family transcriptional regulator [Blastocatellia bacterium]|nr:MerR family transcriptional regulator [Blastocatellia bacterium]
MRKFEMRIGQVASAAGVSVDAVRYYEKRGLLQRAARSEAGYRLFTEDAVERIRFIKEAQETGFSLDEVRILLGGGGAEACRRTRDLLQAKLEQVGQRIALLRGFKRTLSEHLKKCENELAGSGVAARCPVIVEIGCAARKQKENTK